MWRAPALQAGLCSGVATVSSQRRGQGVRGAGASVLFVQGRAQMMLRRPAGSPITRTAGTRVA